MNHQTKLMAGLFAACLLLATDANAATHSLSSTIDGAQANAGAGTGSPGTGSAAMTYDDVSGLFAWDIAWGGLQGVETVMHFHGPAGPGANAGVQVDFGNISGIASPSIGSTVINAQQGNDLLAGLWYINIHTTLFPGGEIRGQVVPSPVATDEDGDGVIDFADACPSTDWPDTYPTTGRLGRGRYTLAAPPQFDKNEGRVSVQDYTTNDTNGCSCDQLVDGGYGIGSERSHKRRGCTKATLDNAPSAPPPDGSTPIGTITEDILRGGSPPGSDRGVESAAGNLVADAQLWATSFNGAQVAFMNPGGVRSDLTYFESAGEGDGVVTYGEAFTFQPFGNTLLTFPMTGAQIVSVLQEQCQPLGSSRPFLHLGVSDGLTYDLGKTIVAGDCTSVTLSNLKLNGVALSPTATYMVTANNFLADGGDNFSTFATIDPSTRLDGGNDLEGLVNYLATFSPVAPPSTDRVNELP